MSSFSNDTGAAVTPDAPGTPGTPSAPNSRHTAHARYARHASDAPDAPGFTQHERLIRLRTPLGTHALLVERMEGREGLSQVFRFDVLALSSDLGIDPHGMLGQPALLEILTQHGDAKYRPIHACITAFERLGADGGFARYRIVLEPWLAFLRYSRDSYVWQNRNACEILQEIFSGYRNKGRLDPAFRFVLAAHYPVRDIRTQYEETDLAFVERLLADEGLFYWFEHSADDSDNFGRHTLVIVDRNDAFAADLQQEVRYHRAAAVEREDAITGWHAHCAIAVNALTLGSWNEIEARVIESRIASPGDGDVPLLATIDHPGMRHFTSEAEAEHASRRQLEALTARGKTFSGHGTVRTFAPGSSFLLRDHPVHEAERMRLGDAAVRFALVEVRHRARNNLSYGAHDALHAPLPQSLPGIGCGLDAASETSPDEPIYRNEFIAVQVDTPWRPLLADRRGALLHPKPTVTGLQTAIVVGHAAEDITTDRDYRVKVQMHWRRGSRSQTCLAHPRGEDNAPGDGGAYAWVRIATPMAGPNWGTCFIPRIGQEVILAYIEGDIDRPIVTGCLYNGRGRENAQGNRIAHGTGPATGNAPAWFAGNGHPAILSGFKTQEIGFSKHGTGGSNAMIFDDTAGQAGVRLQTTQARSQLNLGHIKRQSDNDRTHSHGHGIELTTEAHGALRAGKGLLISADGEAAAHRGQMDAREARQNLEHAHALQSGLADRARKHNAIPAGSLTEARHTQPETVLARVIESLSAFACGAGAGVEAGKAPAFGRPDAVISASDGIALLTPEDIHFVADSISIAGGIDAGMTAGHHLAATAGKGIALFTAGDAAPKRGEAGDSGIQLHAARGKVEIQAHDGGLAAAADRDAGIVSTHGSIEAAANTQVMLAAGGAFIRIGIGGIDIHAPGKVVFKAPLKRIDGPAGMAYSLPALPKSDLALSLADALYSQRFDFSHLAMNEEPGFNTAFKNYSVYATDGRFLAAGTTDASGLTARIFANRAEKIRIAIETGEWQWEERFEVPEDTVIEQGIDESEAASGNSGDATRE